MSSLNAIPDKPALEGLEAKWGGERWSADGTFLFDRIRAAQTGRDGVYSIDTPASHGERQPAHRPRVQLHPHRYQGAVRADARQERVLPDGWDDNGLPTERRVQNYYGVRCDPSLPPYDPPDFTPPFEGGDNKSSRAADQQPISRRNFIELCEKLTVEDEKQFEALFRQLGLSVDWTQTYRTISDDSIRQSSWRSCATSSAARPTSRSRRRCGTWTSAPRSPRPSSRTATSRPRTTPSTSRSRTDPVTSPSRPRGPSCCPRAWRSSPTRRPAQAPHRHEGAHAVLRRRHRDPRTPPRAARQGTGAAMVCTFGDVTDIVWWRELRTTDGRDLPNMTTIGLDGRFLPDAPASVAHADAAAWYVENMAGKTVFSARKALVEKLQETGGAMTAVGKPFNHAVKFFEKGDRPLEIVSTRQWYIRNGARDTALRDQLLANGAELNWHPEFMRVRYENWVGGLTGDWLVSRQRFFGVPIPLWYALDENGERDYDRVLIPRPREPADRSDTDVPPGYTAEQRGVLGASTPRPTSWTPGRPPRSPPAARRRLGARSGALGPGLADGSAPAGSGHHPHLAVLHHAALDLEDGRTPVAQRRHQRFHRRPPTARRCRSRRQRGHPRRHPRRARIRRRAVLVRVQPSRADAAFDPQNPTQVKIGRRLAIKILNAAKFVLSFPVPEAPRSPTPWTRRCSRRSTR